MGNSPATIDYAIEAEDVLALDVSDEALESAAAIESVPHKTGCTSYCPAYSC